MIANRKNAAMGKALAWLRAGRSKMELLVASVLNFTLTVGG
jgi:hypothetical protein